MMPSAVMQFREPSITFLKLRREVMAIVIYSLRRVAMRALRLQSQDKAAPGGKGMLPIIGIGQGRYPNLHLGVGSLGNHEAVMKTAK
jgi:hypothetical protein